MRERKEQLKRGTTHFLDGRQTLSHLSFANWKIKDCADLRCIGHSEPPTLRVVIFIC